jgi:hypothetical protein
MFLRQVFTAVQVRFDSDYPIYLYSTSDTFALYKISFDIGGKKLSNIRKIVLDVLKPHKPDIVEYAEKLSEIKHVSGVSIFLNEVDQETENIKVIIEGFNLNYRIIRKSIEDMAGSVHSVDAVYAGEEIIEEVDTPQDR